MARLAGAATKLTQTLEPSPILQLLIRGRLGVTTQFSTAILRGRKGGKQKDKLSRNIARNKSCSR
jgi:hypothetical protein